MKCLRDTVLAACSLWMVGCLAPTDASEGPRLLDRAGASSRTELAEPGAPVRGSQRRLVRLGEIEGYGNPQTGELWMRAVKKSEPVSSDPEGVRSEALSATEAGFCEVTVESDGVPNSNPAGTFEYYTNFDATMMAGEESSFDETDCFNRLDSAQQVGSVGMAHSDTFASTGVGCAYQHIGNFTSNTYDHVYLDIDVFNGNVVSQGPYGPPFTTGTSSTPAGRNAPNNADGLWDFGAFTPGQSKEMWIYFKNGASTDFTFTGFLVGEVYEDCGSGGGDGVDDDCDGVVDNGCEAFGRGADCYSDADCSSHYCSGPIVTSGIGAGGGVLGDDMAGACENGNAAPRSRVGSGWQHGCAITLHGGRVKCWGDNSSGALGVPSQSIAVTAPDLDLGAAEAVTIAVGQAFNCAIFDDDTLRCWGSNTDGQATGNGMNMPADSGGRHGYDGHDGHWRTHAPHARQQLARASRGSVATTPVP